MNRSRLVIPVSVIATIASIAFLLILLLRTAWVTEDAYIAFRVSDNFIHGYGLRWNVDERVQTYTDPLFLALVTLAIWVSGNVYLSAIVVSLVLTVAALLLIFRGAYTVGIVTAATALAFSKGFIDFSVSGLENPMTHLAIALYLLVYWRKANVFQLSLIAALAATNRMDTVLFFIPSLVGIYWRASLKAWRPVLLGWSPFIAWSLFALFYYGFLFPNTAYAKLYTRIPTRDMIAQGISYTMNEVRCDGASVFVILLGLIIAWFARERLLALGVVLNLIYIIRVGGDFMSTRFYTASIFMCVAIIARYWKPRPLLALGTLAIIAWFGMAVPSPTVTSATEKFGTSSPLDMAGIADERCYYNYSAGLLNYHRDAVWPASILTAMGRTVRRRGDKVYVFGNIGYFGYTVGPGCHVIDYLALGDALIARLPIQPGPWRVGHYRRDVPEGYVETISTGVNQIADPQLHEYYNHLHSVISGNLWSATRLKEIFLFNIGYYEHLLPKRKEGRPESPPSPASKT